MELCNFFSRSVPCFLIVMMFEVAYLSPKPCFAASVSFAGLTSFTRTVDRFALAANVQNSLVGAYSRSRTVAALSLLEQEKLEEARATLAQTVLTLAVLDIGGGLMLPIAEEIVKHVRTHPGFESTRTAFQNFNDVLESELTRPSGTNINSNAIQRAKEALKSTFRLDVERFPRLCKIGKVFTKATKWLNGATVFEVLGPLTDTLTVGLNIWGLTIAIRDNNPHGIAAASLSIAGGLVGLTTFVAAIATGTAVLGPIGAVVGALLGLVATLVELLTSPGYDKAAVDFYRERIAELRRVRDASKDRIDQRIGFLEKAGSSYSDVYVINQAGCITEPNDDMDMIDVDTRSKGSFYERRFTGNIMEIWPQAREEIQNGQYVCIGNYDFVRSPRMPHSTGNFLTVENGVVGFDFYGKFKSGTEYGGVHVFVESDMVSNPDFELRGIVIDTAKYIAPGHPRNSADNIEQNDVISIGDYKNLKTKPDSQERVKIQVRTRNGHDCLNINGMIGKFESQFENKLVANLGTGRNVLSFQGMTRDRNDIKGVFFDSNSGVLKYYYGENRNMHPVGTVRNVSLINGSPFNDHVIPYAADFKVVQISGSNEYVFNCDDLAVASHSSQPRQFQIVDQSTESPKLNLITASPEITENDVILQNRMLKVFDRTGESPILIFEVLLETASTSNLFINNANSRPIDLDDINPVLITGARQTLNFRVTQRAVRYADGDHDDLLFLKWRTDQERSTDSYNIYMQGGTDYVVISDKYLLDPCGIDGQSVTLFLSHGGYRNGIAFVFIMIDKPRTARYGFIINLWHAEKIINEYGNVLFEIPGSRYFDRINLYDKYIEVTRRTLNIATETAEGISGE